MVEYSDRLKAAMELRGVKVPALAAQLGMSYQGAKKAVDGRSKAFSAENNSKAAMWLGVNPDWLATGEGEMLQRTTPDQAVPTTPSVSAASTKMSLGQTLARLGQELGRASPQTRAAVADLLSRYAQNPAQGQSLAQAIEMLVQSDTEKKADA